MFEEYRSIHSHLFSSLRHFILLSSRLFLAFFFFFRSPSCPLCLRPLPSILFFPPSFVPPFSSFFFQFLSLLIRSYPYLSFVRYPSLRSSPLLPSLPSFSIPSFLPSSYFSAVARLYASSINAFAVTLSF